VGAAVKIVEVLGMKMRKLVLMVVVGGGALLGSMTSQVKAQTYPNVADLTPFTQPANYMSLPGVLRLRYLVASGRWISHDEAVRAVVSQGAAPGPAPAGNQ